MQKETEKLRENKILTVVIPTYNMEKYLRKCLESLIISDENMKKVEVLVINDGSKDSSSKIAHEYESKYPMTFRVIDKENGNYGSCINRGLKEATGKYIKVLDADDYYVPSAFDAFLSFLQKTNVDLIINDFCIVDENDAINESYTFDLPINNEFTLQSLSKPMIEWLWHQALTYKTSILHAINYVQTEGISYTYDEWSFKPMSEVHTLSYFPYEMYRYLLGREGQTFDLEIMKKSFDKRIVVGKSLVNFYACVYDHCSEDVKCLFLLE